MLPNARIECFVKCYINTGEDYLCNNFFLLRLKKRHHHHPLCSQNLHQLSMELQVLWGQMHPWDMLQDWEHLQLLRALLLVAAVVMQWPQARDQVPRLLRTRPLPWAVVDSHSTVSLVWMKAPVPEEPHFQVRFKLILCHGTCITEIIYSWFD